MNKARFCIYAHSIGQTNPFLFINNNKAPLFFIIYLKALPAALALSL